jgi:hypothetical protein
MPQTQWSTNEEDYCPPTKRPKLDKQTQTSSEEASGEERHTLGYIREHREVREFLLRNTGHQYESLFTYVGVPSVMLQQIRMRHPLAIGQTMASTYDVWYPVALKFGSAKGVTPRQILAHGYREIGNNLYCKQLVKEESAMRFIIDNHRLMDEITNSICDRLERQHVF